METSDIAAILFWLCAGSVLYAYLGYPLLIWLLARCFGKQRQPPSDADADLPTLTLLVAAYNEEDVIEKRIQVALAMDYPADKREIVIASDGSSDGTAEIVRSYAHRGVRLLDYKERRGKAATLNAAFGEVKGDVVLLSDANTQIEPVAHRRMARWFRDPRVGVVCGRLVLRDPGTSRNVDDFYWRFETFLKKSEARLGALLGANGAVYTIRRELHRPVPPDTIVDDFVIPLQAKLQTGCTILYEADAVAHEETAPGIGPEFHRRSRLGAGGFQSLCRLWPLLHPRHGWTAFTLLSHKVMRWFCPFYLVGMLASSTFLVAEPFYAAALGVQVAFYGFSLLATLIPARVHALKSLRLATMFTGMNIALLVGFWRWALGLQKGAWRRTPRRSLECSSSS